MKNDDLKSKYSTQLKAWIVITYLLLVMMAFFSALGSFFVGLFFVLALGAAAKSLSVWVALSGATKGNRSRKASFTSANKTWSAQKDDSGSSNSNAHDFGSILESLKKLPVRRVMLFLAGLFPFAFVLIIIYAIATTPADDIDTLIQEGNAFYEEGYYELAYQNFQIALEIDRNNTEALFGYGNTLFMMEHRDSALYYYEKVLIINPEFYDARYNKALVFYQQGKYDQTVFVLEELLKQNSNYATAYQLMGDCHYTRGQYEEALRWYQDAFNYGIRNLSILHLMAFINDRKGETATALYFYKEALQYDDKNADILNRLAQLLPGEEGNEYRQRLAAVN